VTSAASERTTGWTVSARNARNTASSQPMRLNRGSVKIQSSSQSQLLMRCWRMSAIAPLYRLSWEGRLLASGQTRVTKSGSSLLVRRQAAE
jgi:hypothetical protein